MLGGAGNAGAGDDFGEFTVAAGHFGGDVREVILDCNDVARDGTNTRAFEAPCRWASGPSPLCGPAAGPCGTETLKVMSLLPEDTPPHGAVGEYTDPWWHSCNGVCTRNLVLREFDHNASAWPPLEEYQINTKKDQLNLKLNQSP